MRSASFVMEGTEQLAQLTAAVVGKVFDFNEWKNVVAYQLSGEQKSALQTCISNLREIWWPVARQLLLQGGQLDIDELDRLRNAIRTLDELIEDVLGRDIMRQLFDSNDAFYVSGSLPLEWATRDGFPLCLYAPFYRFAKPQDLLSMHAPHAGGQKLVIAPLYAKPELAGINKAIQESAIMVRNDDDVTILDGAVTAQTFAQFERRHFSRLLFHGHGTANGILASDGALIEYREILDLVQGPAFLIGCSTGAFETGALDAIASRIPFGLHGALLSAFPISGGYTREINRIVMGTFRKGDARRVQHIAHMSRLALAQIAIYHALSRLSGVPFKGEMMIVTPFEADYERYDHWSVGVDQLRADLGTTGPEIQAVVTAIVSAFAMAITSCGTPAFLLADADPRLIQLWKAFSSWDGKS